MKQDTMKACGKCSTTQKFLIWCNDCNRFYCSPCFKEYETLRETTQHSHSYGDLLGQKK